MQWRMSLSWISGYLSFYIFTPVLFYFQGPVVAGKMGMTWMVVNGLTSIVSAWVTPKAPIFGVLISQKKYNELDDLFWRLIKIVFIVSICIATGIWITTYFIYVNQLELSKKILEPLPTFILLLATVILASALPMAVYLRSHKSEPLLGISVIGGLLNALLLLVLGKYYSALGVSVGYLAVTILQMPFVIYIWQQKRKEWH
jgi:O-antigen/teichoic acid export membrane protein